MEKNKGLVIQGDENLEFLVENEAEYRKLMTYYRCAIMEVETKFRVLNEEFSLQYDRNPIETIKSRLKSVSSVIEKIERKGYPRSVAGIEENMFDIAGVRVVCSFQEDIYMLAECLLSQDDIILVEKKDYIKNPKENGYRSLHLIVKIPIFLAQEKRFMHVEVQLRTIAMDFWASLDHKLKYKKGLEDSAEISKELKYCADVSAQLDEKMGALRKRIGW